MKKLFVFAVSLLMVFNLVGCGGSSGEKDNGTDNSNAVEVDKGLLNVEVHLPVTYFDGQTPEEIKAEAKELGYKDCIVHEDGSVTYKMSKSKHEEMLDAYKKAFDESIAATIIEEEGVVKDIKYNNNLSKIDVYLDEARYDEWDGFSILGYYMMGGYYQMYEGSDTENIDVVVNAINADTKEIIDTFSLSDLADEEESE